MIFLSISIPDPMTLNLCGLRVVPNDGSKNPFNRRDRRHDDLSEFIQCLHLSGDEKPFLNQLVGISTDRFANFVQYDILNHDNDREIFEDVLTGRKLILGTTIRDKYNLKEGQVLDLDTGRGIRKYEIIGFIKTKDSDGKIGITSRRNIKNDLKQFWGTTMAMKIKPGYDIDQMKVDVEEKTKKISIGIALKL